MDADDANAVISGSGFSPCRITMEDGSVRIRDSEGDFEVGVEDADIELYRVSARSLELESEDGDIELDLLGQPALEAEIRTADGDVEIVLERSISVTISVDVTDGRISVDLPEAEDVREGRGWWHGSLSGGSGSMKIRTIDGSVEIRQAR